MKKFGFGLMRLPLLDEEDFSTVDLNRSIELVDRFMEYGFNYFDTGYKYHDGNSEIVLREAVVKRYPRDSFIVADKLPVFCITREDELEPIFTEQLERCGVDYFDYYMIHNVSEYSRAGWKDVDAFSFAISKKAEGKIRKLGLSTHANASELEEILEKYHKDMEFIQLQINYLDWENDGIQSKKCVEVARKYDLPIIVMEALKGGFLANPGEEAERIMRNYNPDASPASWGLRFVASIDGVFMVLSGVNSLEQMEENIELMDNFKPLTDEEYGIIDEIVSILKSNSAIPCTKCNYCMDICPLNINIPKLFDFYNHEAIQGLDIEFTAIGNAYSNYSKRDGVGIAGDCIGCEACVQECPQHLDIPDYLTMVSEHFETEKYRFK